MTKNQFKKGLSVLCAVSLGISLFLPLRSTKVQAQGYTFTGEDSNTTSALKVGSTDTGADFTRVHLKAGSAGYASGSSYGRYINIVEADLSNTKLSFEVINHKSSVDGGDYIRGSSYLTDVVKNYSEDDKKIIAAVNGDWMHWVDSAEMGSIPVTSNYRVTTGVTIIDKEIWCSELTSKETAYDGPYSFGITSSNQPVIGMLKAKVTLKNTTKGKSIITDGLNRAPANNSMVVYNERLSNTNAVPTDAYEILIKTSGTNKFTHDTAVTGTVEAIYNSGTTSRHALQSGYLVITARGSRISELQNNFAIGDKVSVTASLYDTWNKNDELWTKCEEAIGGHMMVLKDGVPFDTNLNTNNSNYPTSVIGYKDDGTVMLSMVTADVNGKYQGLKFSQMISFCQEVGYNTCFLLDGGGSTTMVTINAGSYTERSCYSDGAPRKVWNSIALVYDPTPSVSSQGSLSHITVPERFDPFNVKFTSNIKSSFSGANNASATISNGILKLKAISASSDPYVYFNFSSAASKVNATQYKYIVLRYKTNSSAKTGTFKMYLCAGNTVSPTESSTASFTMTKDDQWHTKVVDLSKLSSWTGNVTSIRLDFFEGSTNNGDTVQISNWGFAKTSSEANSLAKTFGGESETTTTATPAPTQKPTATPTTAPTNKPTSSATNKVTMKPTATGTTTSTATGTTTSTATGTATSTATSTAGIPGTNTDLPGETTLPDASETALPDASSTAVVTETTVPTDDTSNTAEVTESPDSTGTTDAQTPVATTPATQSATKDDDDKVTVEVSGCSNVLNSLSVIAVLSTAVIFLKKKKH